MAEIPLHKLHIYQKVRQGTSWIRSFPIYQYKHRLTEFGGCDSAQGVLAVSFNEAEWLFENAIGNAVSVHVDDPIEPIFDGYISRITYQVGDKVFTRGLDEMFNQTEIEVFDQAGGTTTTAGGLVNVAASQAIYGIKRGRINGEVMYGGATGSKTVIRDLLLARAAWPLSSFSQNPGGGLSVTIEMRGWHTVWEWEIYQNADVATDGPSVAIQRVTTNTSAIPPSNAPFIYATGAGSGTWSALIQTNLAFSVPRTCTNGQTYSEFIESIVAGGDAVNPWVCGITKINSFAGNRFVYYRPARTSVFYYQRALSEPGVFRDAFGRKIDPWRVEADRSVQVTDVLFGWNNTVGQDPRATYIVAVDYDAEAQTVSYVGSDDITPQGIFGIRKRYKVRGRGQNRAPIRYRL